MGAQSITNKVQFMTNGIKAATSNSEAMKLLEKWGYTEERMAEGISLANNAQEYIAKQAKEYGEKHAASANVDKEFKLYYGDYYTLVKVSRIALKGDAGILVSIKATGARNRSITGWISNAKVFYGNLLANSAALTKMERFGVSAQQLEKELKQVEKFEKTYQQYLQETGEAQQSTKDRDQAIDMLSNWYSDFRAMARIAFYQRPQLLEILGIVVK
jgi:hypothetical protein